MKKEIHNAADLQAAIIDLEQQQLRKKQQLSESFHEFTEGLKPINVLKNTLNKVKNTPGLAGNVMSVAVSLGAGILSKKLIVGGSTSLIKRLAGNAIKMGVAGFITRRSGDIKYAGLKLLSKMVGKKKSYV